MNMRSIITISAEGPSRCWCSNDKFHQVNIHSGEKSLQRGEFLVKQTYFGLCKEKVTIFVQHGLGSFQQVAGDSFKLIIHCAQKENIMFRMTQKKKTRTNNLCSAKGCWVSDLSGSLQRSWQFPGRDDKAAVDATCPRKSEKGRCSLGGALNPAVSAAVPAFCRCFCAYKKNMIKKKKQNKSTALVNVNKIHCMLHTPGFFARLGTERHFNCCCL